MVWGSNFGRPARGGAAMTQHTNPAVLQIKKYPNRRYYDAINSRHITLKEIHDVIVGGTDVAITDSRSGDDITNLVLTQILLEQDQPKFDIVPSALLHAMIRSNRQMLRTWVERFYGPFMGLLATSQKQFDAYLRDAFRGGFPNPFEWAKAFGAASRAPKTADHGADSGEAGPEDLAAAESEPNGATIADMRRQLGELSRRIEELSQQKPRGPEKQL
jgi:polyhydroxyalkanoate synthesis repressor PhaR